DALNQLSIVKQPISFFKDITFFRVAKIRVNCIRKNNLQKIITVLFSACFKNKIVVFNTFLPFLSRLYYFWQSYIK
ncbi:MAG TPA: hypothetical protein DCQ15_02300, partial [Chitinophagaceae bacterium]|nr:hypothetical protein [Chitinophagaceae bacterium]